MARLISTDRTPLCNVLLGRGLAVVLLVVDLLAGAVLALVDVFLFLRRQLATIGTAVGGDVAVDILLVVLRLRSFRWRHLSALDAVGDALLLQIAAGTDFIVAIVLCGAVVLVVVDGSAQVILLAVHLLTLLRSERTSVRGAIVVNLAVQMRLPVFQVLGFTGCELSGRDAIGDAALLIEASAVHRVHGGSAGLSMIRGCPLIAILAGSLLVGELIGSRFEVLLV